MKLVDFGVASEETRNLQPPYQVEDNIPQKRRL